MRVKMSGEQPRRSPDDNLERAIKAAERNYLGFPNVVGIAAGTKFVKRRATANHRCIHFYVTRKLVRREVDGMLPSFVYARFRNGKVNRKIRYGTDVIKVGRIRMACACGSALEALGTRGAITLLFRNKSRSDRRFYLVTCAHVTGDLAASPPLNAELESECCPKARPFASVVKNATIQSDRLPYDIALARLGSRSLPQPDLAIDGDDNLVGFLPRQQIKPPLPVRCKLPASLWESGVVRSFAGTVTVEWRGKRFFVGNAFLLDIKVQPGDSGGLIYKDRRAIGIVFAQSEEGWAWFHCLEEASAYLAELPPRLEIQIFNSNSENN